MRSTVYLSALLFLVTTAQCSHPLSPPPEQIPESGLKLKLELGSEPELTIEPKTKFESAPDQVAAPEEVSPEKTLAPEQVAAPKKAAEPEETLTPEQLAALDQEFFVPMGIHNEGSFCYFISVLQNIFGLQNMRKLILGSSINLKDKVHVALASVFAKLQDTRPGDQLPTDKGAIRIGHDFYRIYAESIMGKFKDLGLFPFARDDPDVFLLWLRGTLPGIMHSMSVEMEQTLTVLSIGDIEYSRKTEVVGSAIVSVVSPSPGETGTVNILEDLLQNMGSVIEGVVINKTSDGLINRRLSDAGVIFGAKYFVQERYTINPIGSILPIHIRRNTINFMDEGAELHYPHEMQLNGVDYVLNGLVIGVPGHFKAVVCTTHWDNYWFEFDDRRVKRIKREDVCEYRRNVAMLFYVKREELLTWDSWFNFKVAVPKVVETAIDDVKLFEFLLEAESKQANTTDWREAIEGTAFYIEESKRRFAKEARESENYPTRQSMGHADYFKRNANLNKREVEQHNPGLQNYFDGDLYFDLGTCDPPTRTDPYQEDSRDIGTIDTSHNRSFPDEFEPSNNQVPNDSVYYGNQGPDDSAYYGDQYPDDSAYYGNQDPTGQPRQDDQDDDFNLFQY